MRLQLGSALIGTLAVVGTAAAQDSAEPFAVTLACGGKGRGVQTEFGHANFRDDVGGSAGSATMSVDKRVSYDGRLRIQIRGSEGTIRVPEQMMPPMRGKRDENGAFKLTSVSVNEQTISGQFSFNFMNKPKFVIDRTTGDIEMSGFGNGFSGTCERVADEPEARKF